MIYPTYKHCLNHLDGILAIDYYLAKQLCLVLNKAQDELLFHSIIAASQALREGHSCLKISALTGQWHWQNKDQDQKGYFFPDVLSWDNGLKKNAIELEKNHPIVYQNQRLYLRRYFNFEQQLSEKIRYFIAKPIAVDLTQAKKIIEQLFPFSLSNNSNEEVDWQKVAVANTLNKRLSIIAGGPGTGKTFTVTKVLTALQILSQSNLKIALVAPTGKAAMRLNESINKAKDVLQQQKLVTDEVLLCIPDTATTIHRLLGVKKSSHNFRFNEDNLLTYDVILVDELSMIDLPLMCRLFRAVNKNCRVILLGDADQLPSVAAGSILSDLAPVQDNQFSKTNSEYLHNCSVPLIAHHAKNHYDHITLLKKSFRFDSGGEIGELAKNVIASNRKESWDLLLKAKHQLEYVFNPSFTKWLEGLIDTYYLPLFEIKNNQPALTPEQAFEQLNQFRFLVAIRKGERGVEAINNYVEDYLLRKKNLAISLQAKLDNFYHGCPIMVTENNYALGLFNGDTGLIWLKEGQLIAIFQSKSLKLVSLSRLPKIEKVYAMTIHKTQGSEFNHVALILPEQDSPIISSELLYTGITRASKQLSIWAEKEVWDIAVKRKIERYSGLRDKIYP